MVVQIIVTGSITWGSMQQNGRKPLKTAQKGFMLRTLGVQVNTAMLILGQLQPDDILGLLA